MEVEDYEDLMEPLDPSDEAIIRDIHLPSSAELVDIRETFGNIADNPEEIRQKARELLVPMAMLTYKNLMTSGEPKLQKAAADAVIDLAGLKSGGSGTGALLGGKSITGLIGEEQKSLMEGLASFMSATANVVEASSSSKGKKKKKKSKSEKEEEDGTIYLKKVKGSFERVD